MSTKTILAILLAASLAGNAAFLFTAFLKQPPQHPGAIEMLSLSADQAAKFEVAKHSLQDGRTRAHKKMAELRAVLADEFLKGAPDQGRMLNAALEMAQVQTNMRPRIIDHLLALHALLTPTQRETLAGAMRAAGVAGTVCPGSMLFSAPEQER